MACNTLEWRFKLFAERGFDMVVLKAPGFVIYLSDFTKYASRLGDEELGHVMRAVSVFADTGEEATDKEFDSTDAYVAYRVFCEGIRDNIRKYNERVNRNRENANRRWHHEE